MCTEFWRHAIPLTRILLWFRGLKIAHRGFNLDERTVHLLRALNKADKAYAIGRGLLPELPAGLDPDFLITAARDGSNLLSKTRTRNLHLRQSLPDSSNRLRCCTRELERTTPHCRRAEDCRRRHRQGQGGAGSDAGVETVADAELLIPQGRVADTTRSSLIRKKSELVFMLPQDLDGQHEILRSLDDALRVDVRV